MNHSWLQPAHFRMNTLESPRDVPMIHNMSIGTLIAAQHPTEIHAELWILKAIADALDRENRWTPELRQEWALTWAIREAQRDAGRTQLQISKKHRTKIRRLANR